MASCNSGQRRSQAGSLARLAAVTARNGSTVAHLPRITGILLSGAQRVPVPAAGRGPAEVLLFVHGGEYSRTGISAG